MQHVCLEIHLTILIFSCVKMKIIEQTLIFTWALGQTGFTIRKQAYTVIGSVSASKTQCLSSIHHCLMFH